jgi:CRISPR/Cas system-associated exonuclease Cas4 (RecB family)
MNLPILKILDDDLRKQQAERKTHGDYFYAGEIGYCPRKAFLSRAKVQGKEKDSRTLRVFEMGKLHEVMLLDKVKTGDEMGETKVLQAEREVPCNNDKLNIHGRIDLLVMYEDLSQEIVECKSQSSRSFSYMVNKGEGAQQHHICQLWFYLHTMNIEKGQLCYSSKDDMRIVQYPIRLSDKKVADMVLGKINFLNQNWSDRKLPEILKSWECKYCDFSEVCPAIKEFNQIIK